MNTDLATTGAKPAYRPRSKEDTIAELHGTFERAQATVNLMLERAIAEATAGNARAAADAAKAAQNASMAMGITRTKLHELEDRPAPHPERAAEDARVTLARVYDLAPFMFEAVYREKTPQGRQVHWTRLPQDVIGFMQSPECDAALTKYETRLEEREAERAE